MRRSLAVAALVAAGLASATACTGDSGGPGVATASSSDEPSAQATASGAPDARRFAACLRERGIEVADPPPGEQVELATKDERTRAALNACARYAPPSDRGGESPIDLASARAYAACVRDKGFPDFPDPDSSGPRIPKDLIDDERFEAADRECAHHLNEGKGGKE